MSTLSGGLPVRLVRFETAAFNDGENKQFHLTFRNHGIFPSIEIVLETEEKPEFKVGKEYTVYIGSKV